MIAYPNEKCDNVRQTMDFYLNAPSGRTAFSEIGKHLETCWSCQSEWQKRRKLNERVKAAVKKDFAPAHLFDSIRRQIRESK